MFDQQTLGKMFDFELQTCGFSPAKLGPNHNDQKCGGNKSNVVNPMP